MLADLFEDVETIRKEYGLEPWITEGMVYIGQFVKENCHRYTLDRAATMMVQNTALTNYRGMRNALEICRLPYDDVWIEYAFQDRADWQNEAQKHGFEVIPDRDNSKPPTRMGFWLNQFETKQSGRILWVQAVWTHDNKVIEAARKAVCISLSETHPGKGKLLGFRDEVLARPDGFKSEGCSSRDEFDAFVDLCERIIHIEQSYMESFWQGVTALGLRQKFEDSASYDLAAEWKFVLSLLMLINSKNIMGFGDVETYEKLNKARAKKGKAPLLSHRPIKLMLSKVQRNRFATGYAGPRASANQPYWTSGHFKTRKTGVFWWSPHIRGQAAGEAPKVQHYDVRG